jgi:hypothetical protein
VRQSFFKEELNSEFNQKSGSKLASDKNNNLRESLSRKLRKIKNKSDMTGN